MRCVYRRLSHCKLEQSYKTFINIFLPFDLQRNVHKNAREHRHLTIQIPDRCDFDNEKTASPIYSYQKINPTFQIRFFERAVLRFKYDRLKNSENRTTDRKGHWPLHPV